MTKFQKQMMTITVIGALSAATALPATAGEFDLYGTARMSTFYNSIESSAGVKTKGFDEHLQANTRFGANFKNGDFGGKVELGFNSTTDQAINPTLPGTNPQKGNLYTRLAYGTWNFGAGKLTVGQDYNRYLLCSAQVWNDDNGNNGGYGSLYDGRQAQIRVDMQNGLYFALIRPSVNNDLSNAELAATPYTSNLPKLNLGYAGKAGNVGYNAGVVGQTAKLKTKDKQINAVMGYLTGTAAFGDTSVALTTSYGQNVGSMGFAGRMAYDATNLENARGFEGMLQLTQKFTKDVSANLGASYTFDKSSAPGAKTDDKASVFVNLPIKLAQYVTVVPEFDYLTQLDEVGSTPSKAKQWAAGAKWQIDF